MNLEHGPHVAVIGVRGVGGRDPDGGVPRDSIKSIQARAGLSSSSEVGQRVLDLSPIAGRPHHIPFSFFLVLVFLLFVFYFEVLSMSRF
jgi:hypothetical protein